MRRTVPHQAGGTYFAGPWFIQPPGSPSHHLAMLAHGWLVS